MPAAGGIAITISTPGPVAIRGFALDGANSGATGISWSGGGMLEISGCTVRRFVQSGISITASAGSYFIVDKTSLFEDGVGISLQGGPIGTVSNSVIFGIQNSTSAVGIAVINSYPGNIVNVTNDTITNNYTGISNYNGTLKVSRSDLSNNGSDIVNSGSLFISSTSAQGGIANGSGGYIYTYGNNSISGLLTGNVSTIQQR